MFARQKTKIIATLGDPDLGTYGAGIFDYNQQWIGKPSLSEILNLFIRHGVDVVRMNLAHLDEGQIRTKFLNLKHIMAPLEQEHQRRLGLLADLPGPKIRFKSAGWRIPSDQLYISLDDIEEDLTKAVSSVRPAKSTACVSLGEQPFAIAAPDAAEQILDEVREKLSKKERPLVFIGDNDCALSVRSVDDRLIACDVISTRDPEALVKQRKGFTIRGVRTPIAGFTWEDQAKLRAILEADYEGSDPELNTRLLTHIGISFCQNRDDVEEVLRFVNSIVETKVDHDSLAERLPEFPSLIAKIETRDGVDNIEEILDLADGVMIARGDLALQLPTTEVPDISKKISMYAGIRGKCSIMATQMLESMKTSIECSRPEASDVFNAVLDGVDALMLSGETSSGNFPTHAIRKMREISLRAEGVLDEKAAETMYSFDYYKKLLRFKEHFEDTKHRWTEISREYMEKLIQEDHDSFSDDERQAHRRDLVFMTELIRIKNARFLAQGSTDDVTHAACVMASDLDVRAIVAPTASGRTVRMLSRFRPRAWIIGQPHSEFVARKMAMIWGVQIGDILPMQMSVQELMRGSFEALKRVSGLEDATIIFTCGTPLGKVGSTNLVQKWTAGIPPVPERLPDDVD